MKNNKIKLLKLVLIGLVTSVTGSVYANPTCYIMGDSIAQGVAKYIKNCNTATKVGINTDTAVKYWLNQPNLREDLSKQVIIVSLGVNDDKNQNSGTLNNLVKIRNKMKAEKVVWILPPTAKKKEVVTQIAYYYKDYVLNINPVIGKDGIHPTGQGYIDIANHIKKFQMNDE